MDALSLLELIDSTDSSSDEEIYLEMQKYMTTTRPKIQNYIDVVENYSEEQFRQTFRVNKTTAQKLSERYRNSKFFPRSEHGGSEVKPAYEQVLSFLWFAGNKACLRDVAERFGICNTTFFRQQTRIIDFLIELAPEIIKFPKDEHQKRQAANEFLNVAGFPNVIGCVDGSAITIRTPANKIKSTYVNRHDTPSITLQGICDSNRRFIDAFTGPPGKVHDSRVFQMSFISKDIPAICGETFHLLGDSAYPIREYLITPYRDYGNLNDMQKKFNKTLSATRVLIENTFGLLKTRWRQLLQLDFHNVDKVTGFIMSCCVLHNICIDSEDLWDECENEEDEDEYDAPIDTENNLRQLGELKRAELCRLLE